MTLGQFIGAKLWINRLAISRCGIELISKINITREQGKIGKTDTIARLLEVVWVARDNLFQLFCGRSMRIRGRRSCDLIKALKPKLRSDAWSYNIYGSYRVIYMFVHCVDSWEISNIRKQRKEDALKVEIFRIIVRVL